MPFFSPFGGAAVSDTENSGWVPHSFPAKGRLARVIARLDNHSLRLSLSGEPLDLSPDRRGVISSRDEYEDSVRDPSLHPASRDEYEVSVRDPSLHPALQDLADQIVRDLTEACGAFDDPDLWYPGVDGGIEPVPDEHVELVIWASQRELDRELRRGRPSAPLTKLPWRIKRAFAERRRLRFLQWGITKERWALNQWYVHEVPEDPEWKPGA